MYFTTMHTCIYYCLLLRVYRLYLIVLIYYTSVRLSYTHVWLFNGNVKNIIDTRQSDRS